jgi:hypothetical protein
LAISFEGTVINNKPAWQFAIANNANRQSSIDNRKYQMYRRPKFLEVLHAIREEMSRDVDYDVDLFAEMVRSGKRPSHGPERVIRGFRTRAPRETEKVATVERRHRKRAGQ